jgi:hypothetical protein
MLRAFARHAHSRSTPPGVEPGQRASDARAWFRQDGGIATERIPLCLPARSRTSSTGFVDRCLLPAGQGDRCPGRESHSRFRLEGPTSWLLDDRDNQKSAPPGTRTRICSLRRRVLVHRASGAESREGIKPSRAVLQTALLSENRLEHESGQGESNPHRQFGKLRSYR